MKYMQTKQQCADNIGGVCSRCGGKLEPIETVDNSGNPKMTKNLNKLLTRVYSCDTEAGHRLRYHMQRALACDDYRRVLNFNVYGMLNLSSLFTWRLSPEGGAYWANIAVMIGE